MVGVGQATRGGFKIGVVLELALGPQADAGHGLDRLDRIQTGGGFGTEHDRIGAIDHGIGDIEHFGPGRDRGFDHGLQHLRGGDHHPTAGQGFVDDLFLQAGQFGITDFHAQISTGHHHHIAGIDDVTEVGDGLGALDLGHQIGVAAGGPGQSAGLLDIVGRAAERYRDEIHLQFRRQLDIGAVLGGQCPQRKTATEPVQTLAIGQDTVVEHDGVDA